MLVMTTNMFYPMREGVGLGAAMMLAQKMGLGPASLQTPPRVSRFGDKPKAWFSLCGKSQVLIFAISPKGFLELFLIQDLRIGGARSRENSSEPPNDILIGCIFGAACCSQRQIAKNEASFLKQVKKKLKAWFLPQVKKKLELGFVQLFETQGGVWG